MDPVPQASPGAAVDERRDEYLAAATRVFDSGSYILGDEVAAFEREFAAYLGAGHAVGVANGTDALEIALRSVGVGPGDGVVTVAHTAGATVAAVLRAGAVPILVDVAEATALMNPAGIERVLAEPPAGVPIRAIVPVHLYGAMADMPRLMRLAGEAGVTVVEDCAQAHGATLNGVPAGRWGHAAAFSFYPTKNLAAVGDGGAVVTSSDAVADAARRMREYGWRRKQYAEGPGFNSRLDELQAALLRIGLQHLDMDNDRRRAVAAAYDRGLYGLSLGLPARDPARDDVYHQYVVRTRDRDGLRAWCDARGIGTAVHYPTPVHLQPGFRDRVLVPGPLEVSERLAASVVSLPVYPQLAVPDVDRVIEAVRTWPQARG